MARRRRGNPLALAVLTLLYERPMHPYEMSNTLRGRRKEDSIKLNYGSLYSVVESLHKAGLIRARETVREGRRPERTVYEITDSGSAELHEWLSDLVSTPTKEFTNFEAALSLIGALSPDEALLLLDARAHVLGMEQAGWRSVAEQAEASGFPAIFMIESEFTAALREAELAFVRGLADRIRHRTLGGIDAWERMHELRSAGASPDDIAREFTKLAGEEASWFVPTSTPD